VVIMVSVRRDGLAATRRAAAWAAQAALLGSAAVAVAACGGSARPGGIATAQAKPDTVQMIGKIDADMGPMGTFTGIDGWPAMAPADIHVRAGATVVLTIKEYDDMVTPVAGLSPFLRVMGGTETVNGKPVSSVGNGQLAHTFTIPSLGINAPLPVASMDGPTAVRFTFRAPAAPGTYQWLCVTPCGTGPYGISGAMNSNGWMRGHLIVSGPAAASGR
jgi:hypothetical protein